MKLSRLPFVPALSMLVSACSPLVLLDVLVPADGYRKVESIAYGPNPRQRFDLYLPDEASTRPSPVVLFFYGGSWRNGRRAHYRFVGQALAARGIAVAVADYRLYPEVRFPAFVEDGAHAAAALIRVAPARGIDPERVFLMGHSAGAHLAALLALDGRYLEEAGVPDGVVAGLIGLAGPYAIDPLRYDTSRPVFLPAASDIDQARPVAQVTTRAPSALLLHGDRDSTVEPVNTETLARALMQAGRSAKVRLYPGTGHVGIILAIADPFQGGARVIEDIVGFIRQDAAR